MPHRDQPAPPQELTEAGLRRGVLAPQAAAGVALRSARPLFSDFLLRVARPTHPPHEEAARSVGVVGPQLAAARRLVEEDEAGFGPVRLMVDMGAEAYRGPGAGYRAGADLR